MTTVEPFSYQTPGNVPTEILSKILRYCDEKTLLAGRLTCHGWQTVIDETIGVSVAIGKPCRLHFRSGLPTHFQPIELIESVGVECCYVGELIGTAGPFRYPQTIRKIIFDGAISASNMMTLLSPLPALTHLTLHYKALETVKISGDLLNSSTLKSLLVTSMGMGNEVNSTRIVRMSKNVARLLTKIHSHQLEVLMLDAINIPYLSRRMSLAIFTLLLNHKYTLRNLQFYNCSDRSVPGHPEKDEDHSQAVMKFANESIVARAIQEAVHLKRISFGGKRNMVSCEAWNRFIQSQIALQDLFYMNECKEACCNSYPCLTKNSERLEKTLFHLNGAGQSGDATVFDCRIVKSIKKLSHFLVRGRQEIFSLENDEDRVDGVARVVIKMPIIQSIEYTPSTVVVFSLRDIRIKTTELAKFKTKSTLPNVRKFRLSECGSSLEHGIDWTTFKAMLGRELLKEIEIIHSFNPTKWELSRDLDIYEWGLIHQVRDEWEFHAERDKCENVFRTKYEPMFDYGSYENSLRADDVCEVIFQ